MAQTFHEISPVDVTPGSASSWQDVDVSAYIPAGATGVILHCVNTKSFTSYDFGLRKNGSTDNRLNDIMPTCHIWAMIGVDANRILEAYIGNTTYIDIYLVGYTTSGVTFHTNAYDMSLGSTNSWTDIDCSTEAPSAVGLIFDVINSVNYESGLRKNGSTDNRHPELNCHIFSVIGCDANQICEGYINNATMDYFLVGYITDGATFNTNATDLSLGSTGSYADLSVLPDDSGIGIIEVSASSTYNYALRKNGSSEDIYYYAYMGAWAIVACDEDYKIEGKISNTGIDFYLVGYATGETAGAVTYTSTVSMSALLKATDTETITLDTRLRATDSETVNLTTLLKSLGLTSQIALDAVIGGILTTTIDIDTLLRATSTQTVNIDTYIQGQGQTSVNLSALLSALGITSNIVLDAILKGSASETTLLDVLLQSSSTQTVDIDALIAAIGLTETVAIDLILKKIGLNAVDLDAILKGLGVTETITLDTILGGVLTHTVTVDALLQVADSTTITLDLILREFPEPAHKYVIELRTANGALKQVFEAAYNISYTRVLNEPHTLSFNLRGTDSKRSDIRWPYEFWLRNMATGNVIRKFIITRESDSDARSNLKTTINASSLLSQLGCELLQSDLTITDTPADIITTLLTHQRLTPAITLGTVEPTDEISMTWAAGTSILACLNDMLEVIGGYFDVDNGRELTWLNDVGDDVGKQIRQGKNIVELEKDRDWLSFATVLQVSGNGVKLSDITVDLEEADKSSDATYGYLTITQDPNICFDFDTLEILRYGDPTNYEADVAGDQGGSDWTNDASVLDIDWSDYATWNYGAGGDESNMLGIKWNINKVLSGCSIRLQVSNGTLLRIRVYYTTDNFSTTTLISTGYPSYTSGDGAVEYDVDFGETIEVQGLAFDFAKSGEFSGYAYVFSFYGWTEYYDESGSWTNVNDRQVKIALASYHADDTYYLSYNYADFLKDLTAIATWSDEDGNGGEVSGSMSFNRADDADTLLAWAQLYLPTVSYPPTTYQLQSVLLPEVHANFADDEVDVGDIVSVIEDDLGIVVSTRILKITQPSLDLSPAEATMEISSQLKTLADAFRYLLR